VGRREGRGRARGGGKRGKRVKRPQDPEAPPPRGKHPASRRLLLPRFAPIGCQLLGQSGPVPLRRSPRAIRSRAHGIPRPYCTESRASVTAVLLPMPWVRPRPTSLPDSPFTQAGVYPKSGRTLSWNGGILDSARPRFTHRMPIMDRLRGDWPQPTVAHIGGYLEPSLSTPCLT